MDHIPVKRLRQSTKRVLALLFECNYLPNYSDCPCMYCYSRV